MIDASLDIRVPVARKIIEFKRQGPRFVLGWGTIWGKTRCFWTHASLVKLVMKPFWAEGITASG